MAEKQVSSGWFTLLGALMIVAGMFAIGTPLVATLAVKIVLGWIFIFTGTAEIVHSFSSQGWGGFIWNLLIGALTTFAGLVLVFNPLAGAITLTLLLAFYLVVNGVMRIIMGLQLRPLAGSGHIIFSGALGILLGAMIYSRWPASSAWVIGTLVGIQLIFEGWSMIAHAGAAASTSSGVPDSSANA